MARAKRTVPARDLAVRVDEEDDNRLRRLALVASSEAGAPVLPSEVHRRLFRPMLALGESCAECRAGTCDGLVHVRREDRVAVIVGGSAVTTAPTMPCHVPPAPPDLPRVVAVFEPNQGELFSGAPALIVADAPAVAKRGRAIGSKNKPREVTPDSPEYTRMIDVYHLAFVAARGEKPAYTSRDFAAFKALLKDHGFDRACELIGNAFADEFWKKRVTIRKIADDPSLFAGSKKVADSRPSSTQDEPLPDGWA